MKSTTRIHAWFFLKKWCKHKGLNEMSDALPHKCAQWDNKNKQQS